MARVQWNTAFPYGTTANYRIWVAEIIDNLIAAGLVQTTDAGQIDVSTATQPGAGTYPHFAMFRFNDALQATAPVFMKIEFGAGGTTQPMIAVTVGSGTNGSGTLTGTVSARYVTSSSGGGLAPASQTLPYLSMAIHKGGFFGFVFKIGCVSQTYSTAIYAIFMARTTDNTGVETAEGVSLFNLLGNNNVISSQFMKFSPSYTAQGGNIFCLVPGNPATSLFNGDPQAYQWCGSFPDVQALMPVCTVNNTDVPSNTQFSLAVKGTAPRTYVSLSNAVRGSTAPQSASYGVAMLWED